MLVLLLLSACVRGDVCSWLCLCILLFAVGFDNLKVVFQPKLFYVCVCVWNSVLLLAGPVEIGLWQPGLHWGTGFGNS